jgi:hypothetical protein
VPNVPTLISSRRIGPRNSAGAYSGSMTAERLASGLAITAYAAATFAAMWITAHAYARDPAPDESTGLLVFMPVVVFLLPLVTGFAVGRWWALALVAWLVLATILADGLEPLQRPPPSEVEGNVGLTGADDRLRPYPAAARRHRTAQAHPATAARQAVAPDLSPAKPVATQRAEGSSPFIRFNESPPQAGFLVTSLCVVRDAATSHRFT